MNTVLATKIQQHIANARYFIGQAWTALEATDEAPTNLAAQMYGQYLQLADLQDVVNTLSKQEEPK
ncbi:unnamed protein product [marine sediment metagenome]|uniref:Uncharacterized protein n=1 Tax=marine sediment metagenome TaxID=412755 RepID=X1U1W2_9ZZZZ